MWKDNAWTKQLFHPLVGNKDGISLLAKKLECMFTLYMLQWSLKKCYLLSHLTLFNAKQQNQYWHISGLSTLGFLSLSDNYYVVDKTFQKCLRKCFKIKLVNSMPGNLKSFHQEDQITNQQSSILNLKQETGQPQNAKIPSYKLILGTWCKRNTNTKQLQTLLSIQFVLFIILQFMQRSITCPQSLIKYKVSLLT